jgi:DinB superfamily
MSSSTAAFRVGHPDASEYAPFYAGYVARVTEEPVAALESEGRQTRALLSGVTDAQAGHRYAAGKWTVRDVIQHMADVERVMAYRALRIARGDQTPLAGFDENVYAVTAGAEGRAMSELVDELSTVRASTLAMFRGFDAAAWRRLGVANNVPVSVRALAHVIAGHERHHAEGLRTRYGITPR